jgi:PAS domain-containing protein
MEKLSEINVAAEEITERKRAEAERAAMHDRLQQLNESLAERVEIQAQERDRFWRLSQDLLIVTDAQGTVLNINPVWTIALGWTAEDLVGKTGEWLIHPEPTVNRRRVDKYHTFVGRVNLGPPWPQELMRHRSESLRQS